MNKLRKSLVVGVMVLTVLATSGVFNINAVKASASAGDLIKMSGNAAVYYLGADGKRYVFPNSTTYFSWYSDFSGVVTIPATELQSYLLGGNIVMRAGTELVKITTDPSVYAVEPNGVLRKIQSEAQAASLYGTNWNKHIVDVPDSYFTNYTIGTALASGSIPAGSLVKNAGAAAVYYYDGTNYRSVANEAALTANRFDMANVLTLSNTIIATGSAITGAESALTKTSQGGSTAVVITGSGLMVSLNANTAVSNSVINGQALADLASFNFTAANDGAVTVRTLKLKRIGISADDSLSNVYLFDGVTRLTDGSSFSNGMVSFSSGTGLITVAAGQTKTITVKGDVSVATGNVGIAINAASDVVSTGASVTGSFPLQGNLMSMTSATGVSTVVLTSALVATGNTAKAGNMNTIVWSETAAVANKAVDFKYIAFKQTGSMNADDLANLSLYVDGTKVGAATLDANNNVAFNLATPVRLNTGNHTIEMKADIVKGSSRTFSFSLQTAANSVFTDTNYNINVAPTAFGGGTAITIAPTFTISSGTLSVSADATFNDTQIVKTANNATLSKFKVKAFGEDVKINTLAVDVITVGTASATSTEKVNDLSIIVDGNQVGSSQSLTASGTATVNKSFGTTNLFVIPAGTEVIVEVRGSLALDSNTLLTSIRANITGITGQGVTSYVAVTSGATASSNVLSIVSGSMTVAKNTNMGDMTVSKNTQVVKIGSYILSAGSAEGVNVSNIRVVATSTVGNLDGISNLYISENTTPVNPQTNNDFNTNLTIDKSTSKTIDVYANLGDIANAKTITTSLIATYKTTVTQTFGTTNSTSGQTLTVQTGTLAAPTLVTNAPVSALVIGGTSPVAATYKFVATNGAATINELTFNVTKSATTSSSTVVSSVTVGTANAPVVCSATACTATLTGLSIAIPAGVQGTNVEIKPSFNTVTSDGQGGAATNSDVRLDLTYYKYTVSGTQTPATVDVPSNIMIVVASKPTVTLASGNPAGMSSGYAAGASSDVLHFTVANSNVANPINLKAITVTPTWAGNLTDASAQKIKLYDANDLTTALGEAVPTTSGTKVAITLTNEFVVSSSNSFVLKADTTGLTTAGNSYRLDLTSADTFNSGTDWKWNDSTVAAGTYSNGTYVKDLPLTGNTFVK